MGQRRFATANLILCCALWASFAGCDEASSHGAGGAAPSTQPHAPRVASLVPAATDLLLAMGAGDRLVAVSNYDVERDGIRGLPRVGDYQTIDWERIASLHPDVMLLAQKADRMPAGVRQRADDQHIRIVNVKVDNLNDIFARLADLGHACDAREQAETLSKQMHARLDAIRARVSGREKVSTLLTLEEGGLSIAGPGTYLDDLLTIAGGRNAAADFKTPYPTIDREMLRALDPQVVIQLLPNASPQMLEKAKRFWDSEPSLRAVRDHRIVTITDWYCLLPGAHTPDVAERIAAALHPGSMGFQPMSHAATSSATRSSPSTQVTP